MSLIKASEITGTSLTKLLQSVYLTNNVQNLAFSTSPIACRGGRSKVDPVAAAQKAAKRKTRLEKAWKKLQKKQRMVKPSPEMKPTQQLLKEVPDRKREVKITEEMEDERIWLLKDWTRYQGARHIEELKKIDGIIIAQKRALEMLQKLDTELYRKALEIDTTLTPFQAQGPTYTPPIPDYFIDGEYENITKKYEIQYADTEAFLRQLTSRRKRSKKKVAEDDD